MNSPNTAVLADKPGWDFASCWRRLPDKGPFFALLAAWLALFQFLGNTTFGYVDTPSLFRWMYHAYNNPSPASDDGHGNLIPFVVLALLWWKRRELLTQRFQSWWPGLMVVAVALALHGIGYLVQQPRISVVALFTGIYGLMGLVWGPGWLRASFFPYFLVLFEVPFGSLTEAVTFPLRLLVSRIVTFICQYGLAIDVVNEGTHLFNLPGHYEYDVAPACSGIRSLVAITAIAVIYAFMSFRGPWKRVLLVAAAFPLSVIGNTIRLLTIVLAAEFRGQSAGNAVHGNAFWSLLPYVPAILGLLLIGRWLEGRAPDPPPAVEASRAPPTTV